MSWKPKYRVGDRVIANTGATEADNHGWFVARIIESICEYELQHETGPGICFVRDQHIRGLATGSAPNTDMSATSSGLDSPSR